MKKLFFAVLLVSHGLISYAQQVELTVPGFDIYEASICNKNSEFAVAATKFDKANSSSDILLTKLDAFGTPILTKIIDVASTERAIHIIGDQNIYTVLATYKKDLNGKSRPYEWNTLILQSDKNTLDVLNSKTLFNNLSFSGEDCEDVIATHMVQTSAGDYIVVGFISSWYDPNQYDFNVCKYRLPFVLSLDASLNVNWAQLFFNRNIADMENWPYSLATHVSLSADETKVYVTGQEGTADGSKPVGFISSFDVSNGNINWFKAYDFDYNGAKYTGVKTLVDANDNITWLLRPREVQGISTGGSTNLILANIAPNTGNCISANAINPGDDFAPTDMEFINSSQLVIAGKDAIDNHLILLVELNPTNAVASSLYLGAINPMALSNSNLSYAPYLQCDIDNLGTPTAISYFSQFNLTVSNNGTSPEIVTIHPDIYNLQSTLTFNKFDANIQFPVHATTPTGIFALQCETEAVNPTTDNMTPNDMTNLSIVAWDDFQTDGIEALFDNGSLLKADCNSSIFKATQAHVKIENENSSWQVYPTITANNVHLSSSTTKHCRLQVIDSKGTILNQLVLHGTEKTINLSNFSEGVYYIQIIDSDEGKLYTYKILKRSSM